MNIFGETGLASSLAVFCLGLTVGSFLNVVIYRLPRDGVTLSRPRRSFCPSCRNQILWYDNIPVFSWLFLLGRCRFCRTPISFRYPLVELASALLALFVFQTEGISLRFVIVLAFVMSLTAIAFIDMELMVIPDILVRPFIVLGLLGALITPYPPLMGHYLWTGLINAGWNAHLISLVGSIGGLVLGYLILYMVAVIYKAWRGQAGLGDGDPPLLGLIGTYLGWLAVFPVLFLSTVLALVSVGILLICGRFPKTTGQVSTQPIPFGPFLVLSALVWYFFGSHILRWYLGLFAWSSLG
jgi:leader peptidase (prepilin peptidase)/N-methyltransferase